MFHTLEFYAGKTIDHDLLGRRLQEFGYSRRESVSERGEYAIRGGVVDIFPTHFSLPIRLDLSGDTIESIHTFDPAEGRRLEPHRMVVILPSRDSRPGRTRKAVPLVDLESPVDPFVDIEIGDRVVHLLHGIGRYQGIRALRTADGAPQDHFILEFAGRNVLYVPTRDLHLIQRYVSFGKTDPPLSKLGSKAWERLKERTRKGVLSFAGELLDLQARRRALRGHAFGRDNDWQMRLEEEFPYEETEDQLRASAEVKADMEATLPMDRLLCGDVGYGKTEVALRAAFKAVTGGKQVAILVPTTLLAEQHYETFTARLRSFPVAVSMLSRFQTAGEQAAVVRGLADGSCDIVIGTHRLLSKDVSFRDLGLVIIDEEQRFGVRHKEHLKKMRLLVDVLTLTATPIPRTLYLSLVGTRDMSTINTPPRDRKPIQTIVRETDDRVVREAVLHELDRRGQVFFIHNRVQDIGAVAKKLQALVPEARIAVGHGQMPARALEQVMRKFIHGEIDLLVSTTIVESGIDIPNANTLIVNRADLFGLSELYQLRGRVGRFNRSAYAYLLVPKGALLTEDSKRRLAAIERFTHLGAGFNVAMEDLEIRGAGNILGIEQSGYIANVGFDLYCRILRESVQKLKEQKETKPATEMPASG